MANEQLEIPARVELPEWHKKVSFGLIGLGLVGGIVGLTTDFIAFQTGYLAGFFFTFSLAALAGFFLSVGFATTSGWQVTMRRIPEAMTRWLPYAALLGLGAVAFLFVPHSVFEPWLHPHGAHVHVVESKAWWLNIPRFLGTYVLVMGLLVFVSRKMVNHSYAQDVDGDTEHTWKQQGLSGPFLMVFALGYSALAVDFVMSLQPTWFSTMWGVYMFAGHWQACCALICLVGVWLIESGRISKTWLNENHIHDIAKFTFGFTVFYAYIAFSQFLLIWYANLPEEATFFVHRAQDGWLWHSLWIPACKFIIPFSVLLRHGIKRMGTGLKFICIWILVFQAYEMWWVIAPATKHGSAHPGPGIPFVEWSMILGFFGAFMWVAGRSLAAQNIIPIKDPRLHECMHHHQV
jgi:hypothetical protein